MQNGAVTIQDMASEKDFVWVGQQIRRARIRRFPVRKDAERASGISDRTWDRVESARRDGTEEPYRVPPATLVEMCRFLDVNPLPLLQRLGYDPVYADAPPRRVSPSSQIEEIRARLDEMERIVHRLEEREEGAQGQ